MLAALACAGCSGSADKAGGPARPVVLRLGVLDEQGAAEYRTGAEEFADRVTRLSDKVRIHVVYAAAGDRADAEVELARMVRDGRIDLAVVGARSWEELGVDSFRALQTPFLVTSDGLMDAIATSPLARDMLDGLEPVGITGLALLPESPNHPIGLRRALASLADFAGARLVQSPSQTTDAVMRALGAKPVALDVRLTSQAIASRTVDGIVAGLLWTGGGVATANVTPFPELNTLVANEDVLRRLGEDQRQALRSAGAWLLRFYIANRPREQRALDIRCRSGRPTVIATPREVAELVRATRPVYNELLKDEVTRSFIARIRALERSLPTRPPLVVPRGCAPRPTPSPAAGRSPSELNGTYRWVLEDTSISPPSGVVTMTLRDGSWRIETDEADTGTYTIHGNRIVFDWPRVGYTMTFTFRRDGNGTLHLTPALPMDGGDQTVYSSRPWRYIGPPREIP